MTFGQRASKQVVSNLIYSKINFLTKVMLKTLKLLSKIFECMCQNRKLMNPKCSTGSKYFKYIKIFKFG